MPSPSIPRETFSVTYTIEISGLDRKHARVRWEMVGIDEVERIRLRFDPERFQNFSGTGNLEHRHGEIVWTPEAPYAHLTYTTVVDHRRSPTKGFDVYAGPDWIIGRTTDFFPRSAVVFRRDIEPSPESRARLVFHLPWGWDSLTVMPPEGPGRYVVESPRQRLDHPRGWLILGRFRRTDRTLGDTAVTIATAPGVRLNVEPVLALLAKALPEMRALFDRPLPRLVIVVGPDPMWHGGLSGEESYYMHGERPLQSPDKTSPYLHELFHVAAPFRPGTDARWVTEGLAEYYSVELQHRLGILNDAGMRRALELFARHGLWGQDFTQTADAALRNNSAPLVMYTIDRHIRAATGGAKGLDAVVTSLAHDGGRVSTARFLGAIQRVSGKSFVTFFRRHVFRGEEPPFRTHLSP